MVMRIHDMEIREEGREEGRAEGRAEGRVEGRTEGILETLCELVRKKAISIRTAAEQAKLSEEAFVAKMEAMQTREPML